ncbi:MAG: fumarylacetoacetate hydrolase family protein [Clostridiales bacterium]|nr:fumarylacetoacetate hydrolase family protein [Clostridiales bacterium]
MVIARISTNEGIRYAEVKGGRYHLIEGDCFDIKGVSDTPYEGEVKILAPVEPTKIIALGANYKKHAEELKLNVNPTPTIFLKPPTAVIADGDDIVMPRGAIRVDYEAELAIIIGKDCRFVSAEDYAGVILGYTCANDVTERAFQKIDGQWARAKGFDTFCPLGKYIVTDIDPFNLELKAIKNGEVVQQGNTSDMIHGIPRIIEFVSGIMTLKKGDVILTGTPEGIGEIKAGDTIEIEIEKIGSVANKVRNE